MNINLSRYDKFYFGLISGLILPIIVMWLYTKSLYPSNESFIAILQTLYPSAILGKLVLFSIIPNLLLFYVFYRFDVFKMASGCMIGGMPYLIFSFYLL